MCDTIGKIINDKYAIFGKNSDRAINEAQVVEYYKACDYKDNAKVKCTYIEIDQVKHTNAIILSRPTWLWGGEIGVNEFGLCIGNEALFTKGKYGKDSLIGMDLLRLALERSKNPKEAIEVITSLLDKYGQGGNCGFDSNFHYDNSFLIMNNKEIYVLETKDKDYTYKKLDHATISNCISIKDDGDFYKNKICNFKNKYANKIMTLGAGANNRKCLSFNHKLDNLNDMIDLLSTHANNANPFKTGSVSSVCMHASNSLTADETTMSMIVELKENDITIWITGSSLPCVSLYKPFKFKEEGLIFKPNTNNDKYWYKHELFNRHLVSKIIPSKFFEDREKYQQQIIDLYNSKPDYLKEVLDIDEKFFDKYKDNDFESCKSNFIFTNFYKKKNAELNRIIDKK